MLITELLTGIHERCHVDDLACGGVGQDGRRLGEHRQVRRLPTVDACPPPRTGRHLAVVRDDHQGHTPIEPELFEQGDDLVPRSLVQVAGRLVREDHARILHQRPRDRGALLLAARELTGQVFGTTSQSQRLEGFR